MISTWHMGITSGSGEWRGQPFSARPLQTSGRTCPRRWKGAPRHTRPPGITLRFCMLTSPPMVQIRWLCFQHPWWRQLRTCVGSCGPSPAWAKALPLIPLDSRRRRRHMAASLNPASANGLTDWRIMPWPTPRCRPCRSMLRSLGKGLTRVHRVACELCTASAQVGSR